MTSARIRSDQMAPTLAAGRATNAQDAQAAGMRSPCDEPESVGTLSGGIRGLGLLGVPTSAGSHNAGQDKAPAAWRAAGLVRKLAARGIPVRDFGDLPLQVHRPSEPEAGVRDLARVARIAADTAEAVAGIAESGWAPLVMGGDCTITLGVVAALSRHTAGLGLVYLDGDADLSAPEASDSAVADTMGVTHLLGGGAPALAGLGPRLPLLAPERLALLGFDPRELTTEQWARLSASRLHATPAHVVRADPDAAAGEALRTLAAGGEPVLIHFDVDVLDTGAFPLANFPHFHGLAFEQVERVLSRLCAVPGFAGLVVTEVNPDHDPDGTLLQALADLLARTLAAIPVRHPVPTPGEQW